MQGAKLPHTATGDIGTYIDYRVVRAMGCHTCLEGATGLQGAKLPHMAKAWGVMRFGMPHHIAMW